MKQPLSVFCAVVYLSRLGTAPDPREISLDDIEDDEAPVSDTQPSAGEVRRIWHVKNQIYVVKNYKHPHAAHSSSIDWFHTIMIRLCLIIYR